MVLVCLVYKTSQKTYLNCFSALRNNKNILAIKDSCSASRNLYYVVIIIISAVLSIVISIVLSIVHIIVTDVYVGKYTN